MSGLREFIRRCDAEFIGTAGEDCTLTRPGQEAVAVRAQISPAASTLAADAAGGLVEQLRASALIAQGALETAPRKGDILRGENGVSYTIDSVTTGTVDAAWHLNLIQRQR